jgi:hypothetical protein
MIISNRKKFILFHVPKAGGTSLNNALRKYGNIPYNRLYNYLLDYVGTNTFLGVFPRHISPAELREMIPAHKFDTYLKIAFVRNPFDWHVSQFHFHKQTASAYFHHIFKDMDFHAYLLWAQHNEDEARSNQSKFLSDADGNLLIDFIGKVENLNEDFEKLKIQLDLKIAIGHNNKSKREANYRSYYSQEDRALVEKMNSRDLELFGYEF